MRPVPQSASLLTIIALVCAAAASLATLGWRGSFPAASAAPMPNAVLAEARGWSAATLLFAIPLAAIALAAAGRGSLRGRVRGPSAASYHRGLLPHFRGAAGARLAQGDLLRTAAGAFGWPTGEEAVGHVVHALDLGLQVPLGLAAGLMLLRRRAAGHLIAAIMLVKAVCMGTALTAMVASGATLHGTRLWTAGPFAMVTIMAVILYGGVLRGRHRALAPDEAGSQISPRALTVRPFTSLQGADLIDHRSRTRAISELSNQRPDVPRRENEGACPACRNGRPRIANHHSRYEKHDAAHRHREKCNPYDCKPIGAQQQALLVAGTERNSVVRRWRDHEHGRNRRADECHEEHGPEESWECFETCVERNGEQEGEEHLNTWQCDSQLTEQLAEFAVHSLLRCLAVQSVVRHSAQSIKLVAVCGARRARLALIREQAESRWRGTPRFAIGGPSKASAAIEAPSRLRG